MLHDERILKNKFAYFFTIVFLLGWIIYYGVFAVNVLLRGYRLAEKYVKFRVPVYFLNLIVFALLIVTFIHIFKESKKNVYILKCNKFFDDSFRRNKLLYEL